MHCLSLLAGLKHQAKISINEMLADRHLRRDNLHAQVGAGPPAALSGPFPSREKQPLELLGERQGFGAGALMVLGAAGACG